MNVASSLEPVELFDIAVAIRDQSWLDIRHIEHGTVERVRIKRLQIARDLDEIVVEQRWMASDMLGTEAADVYTGEHTWDTEDIRWMRPTIKALDEVEPVPGVCADPSVASYAPDEHGAVTIIEHAIRQIATSHGLPIVAVTSPTSPGRPSYDALRPRQEAMWLAYEMTNLSPEEICKGHFGYASQQPLITIASKVAHALNANEPVVYGERPGEWIARVRGHAKALDRQFGGRYRRSRKILWRTFL